ncbi:MAG: chromate transporter [Terrimicrobiaceae bacterium]|nr:chromate transporter [Terrimicrobiaceae bacterium]
MKLLHLLGVFSLLSILAIGGGTAVLPEMKSLTVEHEGWLSDSQFRDIYAIGQLAPGPNMLMVIVIGYRVAGFLGAFVAFAGFFVPACIIAIVTSRIWDHFADSPWRLAIQRGMAPIVVGLMLAGTIAIARTAIVGRDSQICLAFAAVVFIALYFGKKINPALLILAGGVLGLVLLR